MREYLAVPLAGTPVILKVNANSFRAVYLASSLLRMLVDASVPPTLLLRDRSGNRTES